MNKILLSFVLVSLFLSCGKNDSSSDGNSSLSDVNLGSDPVVQKPDEYTPVGLSDKVISSGGQTHVPMDLVTQDLTMTFDPVNLQAKGHSVITFRVKKSGRPYFELKATPKSVKLNDASSSVASIQDPDGQSQSYWSVDDGLEPGHLHKVEFDYELASGRVSFVDGGVRFLTDMTDLNGKFFEYWGPTGFEEDAFTLNLNLKAPNSTSSHVLYTNGTITSANPPDWKIAFPNYFSKSSFYVHLTNQTGLPGKKFVYKGLEKDIPVEVYGVTSTLVDSAVSQLPKLFAELEKDYGPYPHAKFLAYLNDRSGGMEYVGATITSVASIDHELLHSWFARSVIPADGRSGWIDEAMASWRDYGYTEAKTLLQRTPTNLANYSPFRKSTPSNAYVDGRALMAELDFKFDSLGGLKAVMKEFFKKYKNKVVNTEEFWYFLETFTHENLDEFYFRYSMGNESEESLSSGKGPTVEKPFLSQISKHPSPLTEEEILKLR